MKIHKSNAVIAITLLTVISTTTSSFAAPLIDKYLETESVSTTLSEENITVNDEYQTEANDFLTETEAESKPENESESEVKSEPESKFEPEIESESQFNSETYLMTEKSTINSIQAPETLTAAEATTNADSELIVDEEPTVPNLQEESLDNKTTENITETTSTQEFEEQMLNNIALTTTEDEINDSDEDKEIESPTFINEGWQEIDGYIYYFQDGDPLTGFQEIEGYTYYFNSDGKMLKGWILVDSKYYFMNTDTGAMWTGWLYRGKDEKSGEDIWYYLNTDGSRAYGWIEVNGYHYYLDPETGRRKTGWIEDNGSKYYLYSNGVMLTGWIYVDGKYYFMNTDTGAMWTGWLYRGKDEKSGEDIWYYLKADGSRAYGWIEVNNKWYFMNTNTGRRWTGWLYRGKDEKSGEDIWYYLKADGSRAYGWIEVNNKWYFMNTNTGRRWTGWLYRGKDEKSGEDIWYYLKADGSRAYGWIEVNNKWYFMNTDTGRRLTGTGIVQIDEDYWYFNNDTRVSITDLVTVDGVTYAVTNGKASSDDIDVVEMYASKKLDEIGWNLKSAFDWAASINYIHETHAYTTSGAAIYSFETGDGDCIGMAAVFYWMAKVMGYDVKLIYGSVPLRIGGYGEHGWVEIVYNGSTYVCDPQFQHQYMTTENPRNGYMIKYGQSGTWQYNISYALADK